MKKKQKQKQKPGKPNVAGAQFAAASPPSAPPESGVNAPSANSPEKPKYYKAVSKLPPDDGWSNSAYLVYQDNLPSAEEMAHPAELSVGLIMIVGCEFKEGEVSIDDYYQELFDLARSYPQQVFGEPATSVAVLTNPDIRDLSNEMRNVAADFGISFTHLGYGVEYKGLLENPQAFVDEFIWRCDEQHRRRLEWEENMRQEREAAALPAPGGT